MPFINSENKDWKLLEDDENEWNNTSKIMSKSRWDDDEDFSDDWSEKDSDDDDWSELVDFGND